jgi:hypothetical protein
LSFMIQMYDQKLLKNAYPTFISVQFKLSLPKYMFPRLSSWVKFLW